MFQNFLNLDHKLYSVLGQMMAVGCSTLQVLRKMFKNKENCQALAQNSFVPKPKPLTRKPKTPPTIFKHEG